MDIHKVWTDRDKKSASNLRRAIFKMKCGEDMLGIEARALGDAIGWLEDLIAVMNAEPVSIPSVEEKKQPAKLEGGNNAGVQTGNKVSKGSKKAGSSKEGSRKRV